jgi:hypothetical protein
MAKTEHDQRVAGPGDKSVVKGHPALNDKENPPTVATGKSKSDANPAKPAASSDT